MAHRKWEVFPGKMRFCCGGRLMCGKSIGVFVFCIGLIVILSGLFFGLTCPYLAVHVSPAVPVFGVLLFALSMMFLIRTGTMDPGVVPRAIGAEATVNETGRTDTMDNGGSRPVTEGYTPPARMKTVTVQNFMGTFGIERTLKYCFTCKIFRPPRSSHCSICDACIDSFDHHCPWVGNCVGRRNYRYFYGFLASLSLYSTYALAFCILHLVLLSKEDENRDFSDVIRKAPMSLVISIISFFAMWSVIGMCGYHTSLIYGAKTTNEEIKVSFGSSQHSKYNNPYDMGGCVANMKYTLCSPLPKSLLDRRALLSEADFEAFKTALYTENPLAPYPRMAANALMTQEAASPMQSADSSLTVTRVASTADMTPAAQDGGEEGHALMAAGGSEP